MDKKTLPKKVKTHNSKISNKSMHNELNEQKSKQTTKENFRPKVGSTMVGNKDNKQIKENTKVNHTKARTQSGTAQITNKNEKQPVTGVSTTSTTNNATTKTEEKTSNTKNSNTIPAQKRPITKYDGTKAIKNTSTINNNNTNENIKTSTTNNFNKKPGQPKSTNTKPGSKIPTTKNSDTKTAQKRPIPKNSDTKAIKNTPTIKNSNTKTDQKKSITKSDDTKAVSKTTINKNSNTKPIQETSTFNNSDTKKEQKKTTTKNVDKNSIAKTSITDNAKIDKTQPSSMQNQINNISTIHPSEKAPNTQPTLTQTEKNKPEPTPTSKTEDIQPIPSTTLTPSTPISPPSNEENALLQTDSTPVEVKKDEDEEEERLLEDETFITDSRAFHPVFTYEYNKESLEITTNIFLPQSDEGTKIEKSEITSNEENGVFIYKCIIKGTYYCKENPSHFGEGEFSLNFEVPGDEEKINFDKKEIIEPEKAPGFYMIKFIGNRS